MQVKEIKEQIGAIEETWGIANSEFELMVLSIPSPASADVPVGTEDDNQVIEYRGEKRTYDFEPKPHWEILEAK